MKRTSTLLWSLVWALAMVAVAFFLKGSPALFWIEAALVVGSLTFTILKEQPAC